MKQVTINLATIPIGVKQWLLTDMGLEENKLHRGGIVTLTEGSDRYNALMAKLSPPVKRSQKGSISGATGVETRSAKSPVGTLLQQPVAGTAPATPATPATPAPAPAQASKLRTPKTRKRRKVVPKPEIKPIQGSQI